MSKKWSRKHKCCTSCKTTEHKHVVHGYCRSCLWKCSQVKSSDMKYRKSSVGSKKIRVYRKKLLSKIKDKTNSRQRLWRKNNMGNIIASRILNGELRKRPNGIKKDIEILEIYIKQLEKQSHS